MYIKNVYEKVYMNKYILFIVSLSMENDQYVCICASFIIYHGIKIFKEKSFVCNV